MTQKEDKEIIRTFAKDIIINDFSDMDLDIATQFVMKAWKAKIIENVTSDNLHLWYENRFKPYIFSLNEDEYTVAAIQALRIQKKIQGTDFGSSRQRDLGQKWGDTIRGYVGELSAKKILKKVFGVDILLDHSYGRLEQFLSTDVHKVKKQGENEYRNSRLQISIKTTKANGMWLDIPGDQFNHSDIHILVSIGIGVDHLFGFFKNLSVFKEKILKKGVDADCLTNDEAEEIYDGLPSFNKIYGYIPGFIDKSNESLSTYQYEGVKKKINYTIHNWSGKYEPQYLGKIKTDEKAKKVSFEGIGTFTQSNRHIYGLKSLLYEKDEWLNRIINKI